MRSRPRRLALALLLATPLAALPGCGGGSPTTPTVGPDVYQQKMKQMQKDQSGYMEKMKAKAAQSDDQAPKKD